VSGVEKLEEGMGFGDLNRNEQNVILDYFCGESLDAIIQRCRHTAKAWQNLTFNDLAIGEMFRLKNGEREEVFMKTDSSSHFKALRLSKYQGVLCMINEDSEVITIKFDIKFHTV
jgi:hypothetical protein